MLYSARLRRNDPSAYDHTERNGYASTWGEPTVGSRTTLSSPASAGAAEQSSDDDCAEELRGERKPKREAARRRLSLRAKRRYLARLDLGAHVCKAFSEPFTSQLGATRLVRR